MKMKSVFLNLSILVLIVSSISCNSVNTKEEKSEALITGSDEVEAYYFHATRRCATCEAVEAVSKAFIEENYATKVSFVLINREEEKNNALVEKYEITGQTLLIVSGDKVVDLTTEAFMNARSNPEKLQELIKSTIDPLLAE